MVDYTQYSIYGTFLTLILVSYLGNQALRNRRNKAALASAIRSGLTEPTSLHPVINPNRCIGCGTCISVCPEGNVLGLIDGKSKLINPTHCIGHGACKAACPIDAITLVFGTETRGVDIPIVQPTFETNVRGIYIAGELGGMGLIRNAVTQGVQAMESIGETLEKNRPKLLDAVIVGAGPAGFAAGLSAMASGFKFKLLEQDSLGGTVSHYPRGKIVMTAPVNLPKVGKVKFTETTKEVLLEFWQGVLEKTGLEISFQERVEKITQQSQGFVVKTTRNSYATQKVLLAVGRRGTPRKLNVPGEEHTKVVYRLIDPEQYSGKHVLVVGGGDSALEAATTIADEPGTTVALSYRSGAFSRAKQKNRQKVEEASANGRLKVLLESEVLSIDDDTVHIKQHNKQIKLRNEAIIVCAGGILPTGFLKEIGIEVETKYGTE